ncbi:MAG: dienelactone hydrolase family protein [Vicinamibacteria bacterium]|nr:dienelactone hydrolase family protein [Vicinamibacteria bacterium]
MKAQAPKSTASPGEERVATLDVSGRPISVSIHGHGRCAVVLGPGAGGTRLTPQLVSLAGFLDPQSFTTVLFNFPYQEARRKFPDPAPVLEETVTRVAAFAREDLGAGKVVLGGRSMGGRMASQAVASGLACDGLAFLAYPLHPPGQETKLRDSHLPSIRVPMLFLQGTRDEFARLDLLEAVLARLGPNAQLALFEDADHSFKTRRGAAATSRQTEAAVFARLADWLRDAVRVP